MFSRWTGGDGAPLWIFEKLGLDVKAFDESGAATLHQMHKGDPTTYPKMIWPTNLHKFGCATMFTLFFGSEEFAPTFTVENDTGGVAGNEKWVSAQAYMQAHYINALCTLAEHLKDLTNIAGLFCERLLASNSVIKNQVSYSLF